MGNKLCCDENREINIIDENEKSPTLEGNKDIYSNNEKNNNINYNNN